MAPTATPPSGAAAGFSADWSSGMDGWTGAQEWKTIPGMLISDGTAHTPGPQAASRSDDSVRPSQQPATTAYAVEARIQIIDPQAYSCYVDLHVRSATEGQGRDRHGYALGYQQGSGAFVARFYPDYALSSIKQTAFSPGSDWHVYRAEVQENNLTLKIDGSTVLQATDNNYLDLAQVGIGNSNCQVQVSSFTVSPSDGGLRRLRSTPQPVRSAAERSLAIGDDFLRVLSVS